MAGVNNKVEIEKSVKYAKFFADIFYKKSFFKRHPFLSASMGFFLGVGVTLLVLSLIFPPFGVAIATVGSAALGFIGVKALSAVVVGALGGGLIAAAGAGLVAAFSWVGEGIRRLTGNKPSEPQADAPNTASIFAGLGISELSSEEYDTLVEARNERHDTDRVRTPQEQLVYDVKKNIEEMCPRENLDQQGLKILDDFKVKLDKMVSQPTAPSLIPPLTTSQLNGKIMQAVQDAVAQLKAQRGQEIEVVVPEHIETYNYGVSETVSHPESKQRQVVYQGDKHPLERAFEHLLKPLHKIEESIGDFEQTFKN